MGFCENRSPLTAPFETPRRFARWEPRVAKSLAETTAVITSWPAILGLELTATFRRLAGVKRSEALDYFETTGISGAL